MFFTCGRSLAAYNALVWITIFYTIQSTAYPGYNLTQRGSHIAVAAANTDNPFQLWYKDDSRSYLAYSANPAFVLLNHGSKTALKVSLTLDSNGTTITTAKVSLVSYDPSTQEDALLWSNTGTLEQATIASALYGNLRLGLEVGTAEAGHGIPAIMNGSQASAQWTLAQYREVISALKESVAFD